MTDAERRADEAKRLLDHPLLSEAFARIETEHMELALGAWTDRKRRHHLEAVKAVRAVKDALKTVITTARVEAERQKPRTWA